MNSIQSIDLTVAQVIKELELLLKDYADKALVTNFDDEIYVSDIVLEDNMIILDMLCDENSALTVDEVLTSLKEFEDNIKVVMKFGWQILRLSPWEEKGPYFEFVDEYDSVQFNFDDEVDIRLFTNDQLQKDLSRFEEDNPDRKIVCIDEDDNVYYVTQYEQDGDTDAYIIVNAGAEECLTVSQFLECADDVCNGPYVLCFSEDEEEATFHTIRVGKDKHVFFETDIDDEDVIAFHLGETINQDENEEWDD